MSDLRYRELDILDGLKREPRKVRGKLNFKRYNALHAELREVRGKMASLTWSQS